MAKTVSPQTLDYYSERIIPIHEEMWEYQKPCSNGCYISEASLKEILFYLSNVTFSIVSPVFPEEPISNNVERLASLRASVQDERIRLYQIIGRWHGNESNNYTIDKGFILIKPDHMGKERFFQILLEGIRGYGQDAFVFKSPDEDLLCIDREGKVIQRYSGNLSLNLLSKAYSNRWPMKRRFSLVGAEIPNGSIGSFQLFKGSEVEYYLPEDFFERRKVKPGKKKG